MIKTLLKSNMYRVYSGKPEQLEEGTEPFLEASFNKEQEAISYVDTWMAFYPKMNVVFWYEKRT